ncbi:DUF2441 domain-containing protein [Acinetobacter sp. ME22]|uniref:DUF2441 domain-containing protein n=1 Tax=Acinetobacter sp. ME22 TaxID=2904802 RepID=UPI001EDC8C94|nr:DUF2441 domain-containing protein [Acinetobacter sp. ME22]MCG2572348.1 DUF2441 domain-containing protein [Acinetobacter sp. ME22]
MTVFFTVDRESSLNSGKRLELITDLSKTMKITMSGMISEDQLVESFRRNYPNGISLHGQSYLFGYPAFVAKSGSKQLVHISPMIEAIFEQVRRADFPTLPSRFTSMFAWQSKNDAHTFKNNYRSPNANIFEVESEEYFLGDMSLLTIGGQVMNTFELAYKYWNGDRSDKPSIEVLLPLPVSIGKLVTQ